ncbi:ATP-binding cassette domain-containing protein [Microbacterium esteraromaticum]|uniref:ATP-binding cassette domain-containing protein n=1 Tax=Microbacterium esteraromaticum TaxID=57043 RepID=A0A939IRU3_9MICO|nr:ATP-binding cassette domain-containing protein [Microbacterium esteraromaticum]MBN8204472.1 ATP-binding cassette domain-containing protein [Microbacterium esteraromaticum]MBN8414626.1 ATP-binding cassette domain-containing protein [Microbacterium esteraromaticum]
MPEGQVLEFTGVTKRFNTVTAVSELSVRVEPGVVTGFLGPNGAGKTTSLRIMLGQIKPTSGTATIGGVPYSDLRQPLRTVGAVLEESAYRPRRSAMRHLLIAAKANGIPVERVEEVLRLVGLQDDADTRLGSYSLGMRQRLAVATALLGDPGVLVLDEPANGLDPEGIRWMRLLMRRLADEGRTVLVSSHVLSEIEQVADNVVVLSRGRAVFSGSMDELADPSGGAVVVDATDRAALVTALTTAGLSFDLLRSGVTVRDSDAARVGALAAEAGIALSTLQQRGPSLEEVFLDLVYGRRADSPRLDQVANPVAHAPENSADPVGDAALVAGGVPLAGAAAVIADGGVVAAAGVGYGTAPIDIVRPEDSESDAAEPADAADEAPAEEAPAEETETVGDDAAPIEGTAADAGVAEDASEAEATGTDAAVREDAATHSDDTEPTGLETPVIDEQPVTGETTAVDDAAPTPTDESSPADDISATVSALFGDAAPVADAAHHEPLPAEGSTAEDAAPSDDATSDESAPESHDEHDPVDETAAADESDSTDDEVPSDEAPADEAPADEAERTDEHVQADGEPNADAAPVVTEIIDEIDITEAWAPRTADATASDEADAEVPGVLPLATEAVSLPPSPTVTSFTELITGIPADSADEAAPATEAISVEALSVLHDDDDDSTVDDDEDDPRLAAMRTSLSSAASRFFDGPAPDYPYTRADIRASAHAAEQAAVAAEAAQPEQTDSEQTDSAQDDSAQDDQAADTDRDENARD